ncbi:MAG: UDP-N-acetylmuramoyl-tripeptide--D-alanyl-D-alanine ligase [Lachnospiraceae bacterium]|nr:UDP-N-acetylmuramoyl-tripeptide--D-alanyl-D-alanine ligase [Lachnospiraceae bacterium]
MKNLSLLHLAEACGGICRGSEEQKKQCVTAITSDSRRITEGCLFAAIPGTRVDGHDFISQVIEKGALGVVSERDLGDTDFPYIQVTSTLDALKDFGEYYLEQLQIPVIGIAGSVGKTSTKEMIYAVLSQKYNALKTEGNFNNELGLPLTIFRLREEELAILEMGIDDFGQMHRMSKVAKPSTCVMTNIGCCHLENLKDRDGILKAKSEIFDYMKADGQIVVNGDDDKLASLEEVRGIRPVRFGLANTNDVWADEIVPHGLQSVSCRIHTEKGSFQVTIPASGEHMVYNALAGCAVGLLYGLTLDEIARGITSYETVNGRFHIIKAGDLTIIDDCYNANPVSMKASLQTLQAAEGGRRTAILGDMGELGENEEELHAEVGTYAAGLKLDLICTVGPLSENIAVAVREGNPAIEVRQFGDKEELIRKIPELFRSGDTILVKASHFMGFSDITEALQNRVV